MVRPKTSSNLKKASSERETQKKPSSFLGKELPTLHFEVIAGYPEARVAGVDEVGRGCLAGPVVAGAVILPPGLDLNALPEALAWVARIADSKLLKKEIREELSPKIQKWALAWGVGVATVEEIDTINIFHASHLAMIRALSALQTPPDHALIDGNKLPPKMTCGATAIVKGDLKCLSIAAASILAKVHRDRLMAELDLEFPGFNFAQHKGYGTPLHYEALREHGPQSIHRRSFAPIAQMLNPNSELPEPQEVLLED
jgi:ribonuclease HII